MTRDEEITKQALKYGEPEYLLQTPNILGTQGFIRGAKWADKTMIEKACEWLKENIDWYSYIAFNTKSGYTEITLTNEFETAFRQAMEE